MTFVVPLAEIDLLTLLLSIRKEVACQDIHCHFILNGLFMQNIQQFDPRYCTLLLLQLRKATARPTCQVVAFRESCRSHTTKVWYFLLIWRSNSSNLSGRKSLVHTSGVFWKVVLLTVSWPFWFYKTIKPKQSLLFIKQNNNFARASRFFVHFFAVVARLRCETT